MSGTRVNQESSMDLTFLVQLLISGILLGGIYALASIGLTMIFGVMKVVNFAHGEFLMIAMYLTYWFFYYFHIDPYLCTLILIPVMFLIGIITYYLFIRPTIGSSVLAQIFITVGLSMIIQNRSSSSGPRISGASPWAMRPSRSYWGLSRSGPRGDHGQSGTPHSLCPGHPAFCRLLPVSGIHLYRERSSVQLHRTVRPRFSWASISTRYTG